MSVSDSPRVGAPAWRSLSSALARPRLFACLDRCSTLTVIDAPPGFGKRTLVAGWLHQGGAPDHTIVWIPELTASGDGDLSERVLEVLADHPAVDVATEGSDESPFERVVRTFRDLGSPCLLVLACVSPENSADVLEGTLRLLDRCPRLDAIVCLPGNSTDMTEVVLRGIDSTYVPAADLAFTVEETTTLLRDAGPERSDSECEVVCRALGGVPTLVSAAAVVARSRPQRLIDSRGLPTPALARLVRTYVEYRLDELDDAHREFAFSVAAAHSVTAHRAAELTGAEDASDAPATPAASGAPATLAASRALATLAAAGLVMDSPFDDPRTWRWPDAVRSCVLDISRREHPGRVDALLVELARAHRDAGKPAEASIYAVEAGDWQTAVAIVEESWGRMVDSSFDVLVKVLRQIPDQELGDHPSVQAGRALFTQMLDEHSILHASLPTDPDELAELGKTPGAAQAVYVATVQTLTLRVSGEFGEAARLTLLLRPLVHSILEHRPDDLGPQLPLLRVQWAITLQLAGYLTESTTVFRRAYRGAYAANIAFVIQNAAGSSALNWAVTGDNPRAREWLRTESNAEPTEGRWGEMVKVGGRVASTLVHLDSLELDRAVGYLDELGVPRVSEELWGFVAYGRAYYNLVTGNAYDGLTELHRLIASHHDLFARGAFSRILLGAAEIDLHLALGNGNLARALAEEAPQNHPILVVTNARVELFTGHPDVALKKLKRVHWTECGFPRAHLEALLVEASAHLDLDEKDAAVRSWQRACTLAEALGNRRAFTTLAEGVAGRLAELGGPTGPDEAIGSVFTEPVTHVELSRRETDVLELLALGSTHADIAKKLFVSHNTIKTQLRSIYRKLGVHTRVEAIGRARDLRLLPVRRSL
ncbi:LuxR family maltose regulon positive regulatory protein [Rhodococcus rhodochrous J45]|uniref:LuxR family maltose regulon positive regulatory protein n=1 Tax=Rhodococcus rhodochrous J45 TaxID=935266 RepID=A0A562E7C0_RHORH|nr:LuxR C-terminal-related transcriptional regulator [Rhodococcus rhodochrous]TWH17614.1 LuxR family maltose regulon positive regulatory protein [Rhodococcus rhodochrous J45]